MSKTNEEVESLIKKASKSESSLYALQFSQAALNAANAIRALADTRIMEKEREA